MGKRITLSSKLDSFLRIERKKKKYKEEQNNERSRICKSKEERGNGKESNKLNAE